MKQPTGNMWQEAAVRLGSTDRGKKQKVINAFKEQTTSVRDELSLFLTETSFTPIVLIYNSTSALKKLAWSVLVLGFLAYSIVQCYWLLERYYSYPVEVKLDLKASVELEFPSVTICNLNPIRQSSARHEPYKALEKFVQPESDDILFKATLKSWVFEETCTESDFQCSNGRCVSKGFVCDGIDDCNNNDDEANCAGRKTLDLSL
ncbi:amiloride-sensitive sodium channel subunit gamma-like [Physella acuta]|uniref:amiloride-sensitive sodium channel subunit gamma-like n=1 Tax=Physella acuta TaxID=109671 RepID=UPI0027DE8C80|nr:amiloride-sensitive sodium channel subunit gamma-like [Physella acuta]